MEIIRGKVNAPVKAVVYGPEGIGKSSLCARFPSPLFVDFESGTTRLDVARVAPKSFSEVLQMVDSGFPAEFKTIVFDTADWLEKLITEHVLATMPDDKGRMVKSIEGYGYGKGYIHLAESWKTFLDRISRLQDKTGVHVVFAAHSWLRRVDPPDEAAYDRWELKLGKQSCSILKEWADMVLFLNYKTIVEENAEGKNKAKGGKRTMHADHSAVFDAKNRFGLPKEMALDFAELNPVFVSKPATVRAPEPKAEPKQEPVKNQEPEPIKEPAKPETPKVEPVAPVTTPKADPEKDPLIDKLKSLMAGSGVSLADLQGEMSRKGICTADQTPRQYNIATLNRVIAGWAAVAHNIQAFKSKAA